MVCQKNEATALSKCAAVTMFYALLLGDRWGLPLCMMIPEAADSGRLPCRDCPITEGIMRALDRQDCVMAQKVGAGASAG
jgi:hypothetical protein